MAHGVSSSQMAADGLGLEGCQAAGLVGSDPTPRARIRLEYRFAEWGAAGTDVGRRAWNSGGDRNSHTVRAFGLSQASRGGSNPRAGVGMTTESLASGRSIILSRKTTLRPFRRLAWHRRRFTCAFAKRFKLLRRQAGDALGFDRCGFGDP